MLWCSVLQPTPRQNAVGSQVNNTDMSTKKTVFLTGATGNMGQEAVRFFLERRDRFALRALVLPTANDRKIMEPMAKRGEVKVIWGDLTKYEDVLEGVAGADYVLHVGGMVSPYADHHPELTTKVNLGAIRNILRAIKAQPEPDRIKLVYIGTVAETGNRMPPIHWGRCGDPVKVSVFDNYAVTKTIAESLVVDSGLKHWVSLRQTAIAHKNLWRVRDPIIFHNPLKTVFEWVTATDSGRLVANVCEESAPEGFWRNIYNIGGGESCRVTNDEFFRKVFGALGIKDYQATFEPNWFALRNFHGQWYMDSDRLEAMVPYRKQSVQDFANELARTVPGYVKLGGMLPAVVKSVNRSMATGPGGTLRWIKENDLTKIEPFFGSRAAWERIGAWDTLDLSRPSSTPKALEHGYDEQKSPEELSLDDLKSAAKFRGGSLLASDHERGNWSTVLRWRCGQAHEFEASPRLVLKGGHWCQECTLKTENYPKLAKDSPFFAQVYEPDLALVAG